MNYVELGLAYNFAVRSGRVRVDWAYGTPPEPGWYVTSVRYSDLTTALRWWDGAQWSVKVYPDAKNPEINAATVSPYDTTEIMWTHDKWWLGP